jgi:hypothetical protein
LQDWLLKMPLAKKRYSALLRQLRTFDWKAKLNGMALRDTKMARCREIILDSSAVVKWFSAETKSVEALRL